MGSVDAERLHRLLGGVELANLRQRLRARYERGASRDEFTLTDLSGDERRALAGLLGRRTVAADSMRIRRSAVDAALARAGIAATLREALEFLDGPVSDRRAARTARDAAWSAVLGGCEEPRLTALLADAAGGALLRRVSGSDPAQARALLSHAARVLARLPGHGMPRAQLAAEVLGDAHGLDSGRPVATIVLRACALDPAAEGTDTASEAAAASQDAEESSRERWARVGITVNELAAPALCLNLPFVDASRLDAVLPRVLSPGAPLHLSLRRLLRNPLQWNVAENAVFVCENPNIVAIAADRFGAACAPLVCTDGMPSAAQQTLLAQLAAAGARLRYHGDFDWPGVVIGNFVIRAFGATPWRFGAADYGSAAAAHGLALRGTPVEASWDDQLAGAMAQRRIAVHEESVADTLLMDLEAQ